ncbi:membrane glycosyltransferase [Enhydrobacter aerosaccus]|uniref:Glucans biosynthesis glucosyltransferase H n=1 Tax=Enhydrobacter aerosaccus TaxID=225324 RepID=A0A1T4SPQ7_9HYPH|nr:glucans biosynthesis glucosyltransferase MdoH [Enhydrobacter aerosaccus]SKA30274.1 membrane glycosyltransferase [Enhydrobacter aerosaccus]
MTGPAPWALDCHAGRTRFRRALLFTLVVLTAALGGALMWIVVGSGGLTAMETALLVIFVPVFASVALSFWSGVFGFVLGVLRLHPISLSRRGPASGPMPVLRQKTAILIPVYNEDPVEVAARLDFTWRSLAATGQGAAFDFFVLSDTQDAATGAEEERTVMALRERLEAGDRISYRRRTPNTGKKAGNIAEWVAARGAGYAHMIIFDADSVMEGETLVRLAALMEANPRTGIIQTHIVPAGRETLFARVLQFSTRMTGAVLAMGNSFWHLGDSNYYGHNAILRVAAFAECCRLPVLSGKPPLGGEILSHDFVEAAFMRRGGWYVWLLPELHGSYEELPTNLLDYALRDRRWMQGNLQHARLLGTRGLHWVSRLHLGMGIFAYLASPLWLALLLLSTAIVIDQKLVGEIYFGPTRTLFPIWPRYHWAEIHGLLILTLVMLFGPKVLALGLRLASTRNARRFGGRLALVASFVGEIVFSTLLAPVMMLFHTSFMIDILMGNAVGWPPQARGDRGMAWRIALKRHVPHALLGIVAIAVLGEITPNYLPWIIPVVLGLIFSAPVAVLSSRRTAGVAARRLRVFVTPEEGPYAPTRGRADAGR